MMDDHDSAPESFPRVLFAGSGGGQGEVKVCQWDWQNPSSSVRVIGRFPKGYSVYALAVSPSARYLAVGTRAGLVRVYPLSGGLVAEGAPSCYEFFHHHTTPLLDVNFCVDDHVVTAGKDGTIRIWSVSQRKQLAEIAAHSEGVIAIAPVRSLFLASIGREGTLKIWDLDNLRCGFTSPTFPLPKTFALTSLVFSETARRLFHPTGAGDLVMYDLADKLKSKTIRAHDGDFCAIAVNPRYLATAGMEDRRIRIWDLNPEIPLFEAEAEAPVISMAWISAEELVTVYANGQARMWHIDQMLSKGPALENLDLRMVAGLSERGMAAQAIRERRRWQLQQIRRGQELLRNLTPSTEPELLQVIEELEARGFVSEAMIFRTGLTGKLGSNSEYLAMFNRLVATLRTEHPGDPRPQLAPLYGAFDLLLFLGEPGAALEYGDRIREIDAGYLDTPARYQNAVSHPLLSQAAERIVRLDFQQPEIVNDRIEVATVLGKRFLWNVLVHRYAPLFVAANLALDDWCRKTDGWNLLEVRAWDGQRLTGERLLIRSLGQQRGLSLGVQLHQRDQETQLTPCLIFRPSELALESQTDAADFNRAVKEAFQNIERPDENFVHRWLEPLLETVRAINHDHRF